MKPLLIGEDPFQLERIRWKLAAPTSLKLFGYVFGWAGLEFALLDIQGQATSRPVSDLIGGRVREEFPSPPTSSIAMPTRAAKVRYRTRIRWLISRRS